eukprot:scaffold19124_cov62-Phaeocystis_antarctica.AAC.5
MQPKKDENLRRSNLRSSDKGKMHAAERATMYPALFICQPPPDSRMCSCSLRMMRYATPPPQA